MIATTSDSNGRQVDLEVLQSVVKPVPLQRLHLTAVNGQPKMVAGLQKAVQRYTVLLLTNLGDLRFDPDVGGTLVTEIASGNLQNLGYLYHVFALSNANALRILAKDDNDEAAYGIVPDDERLVSATVTDAYMDYTTGTVNLQVELTTAAGAGYAYVIPVNTMR